MEDTARFHETLRRLDARIAGGGDLAESAAALFQGPIADALTHVGQINMLRRLAGVPISGENYHRAEIVSRTGRRRSARAKAGVRVVEPETFPREKPPALSAGSCDSR